MRASAPSAPETRTNVSWIQSGYDSFSGPSGSDVEQRRDPVGEPAHHGVRERHGALEPGAADELDRLVRGRMRRGVGVAELVRAEPQRRAHGRIELAHRPLAERLDRVVERPHALHGAVREPLRERALALVEPLARRVRNARSAYASCSNTRSSTSYAARRAASGITAAAEVRVVRHAAAALGLHLERLERAVVARAGLPDEQVADDRARADVRRERADAVDELLRRRVRSSSRSSGAIFSAYVDAVFGLRREARLAARARRSSSRAATSAERAKTAPASSSGRDRNASCAAIGPASSSSIVRWIVTPVSSSPAISARSTGAAPRQRGSSDGCTFSQSARSSSAFGISRP